MLEAFALSDKGCVRANNEDYCLIDQDRGLYVLADGMGGARAGEQASRMAVETVAETVRASRSRDSQVLIRAAEEANRRVLEAAHNDPCDLPADAGHAKAVLPPRQQRSREREGQGKHGVLELDHFERQAETFPHIEELVPIFYRPSTNR